MRKSLTLIVLIFCAGCSGERSPENEANTSAGAVHTLDELSHEQLRVFLKGHMGDWRGDTDAVRGAPPPAVQKAYSEEATLVDLVKPDDLCVGKEPVADIISQRRSRRSYTDESLTNEELSYLLWATQGIKEIATQEDGRIAYHFRTVPSGGARHPFETYLLINRVKGVAPGLYRYVPMKHKLLRLREEKGLKADMVEACYGQTHLAGAAVVFVWAAVPYRTVWKYNYVGYKMIAVEAGHVCQNLYLSAESIGGGACAVLGYNQEKLDALIGVDGADEFAVYLAAVGKIKK